MLQVRLSRTRSDTRTPVIAAARLPFAALTVIAALLAGACRGDDGGGALEDNLIRPGVTAINEATSLACNADRTALETALETYELLQGEPAADQDALVAAGYLRSPSALFDVTDGALSAVDPGCR